jgi:hypothetical protein
MCSQNIKFSEFKCRPGRSGEENRFSVVENRTLILQLSARLVYSTWCVELECSLDDSYLYRLHFLLQYYICSFLLIIQLHIHICYNDGCIPAIPPYGYLHISTPLLPVGQTHPSTVSLSGLPILSQFVNKYLSRHLSCSTLTALYWPPYKLVRSNVSCS